MAPSFRKGKAAGITLQALQEHFNLPMNHVAKKFGVCLTYFKKVCRSHGVMRWPYRQVTLLTHLGLTANHLSLTRSRKLYAWTRAPLLYRASCHLSHTADDLVFLRRS